MLKILEKPVLPKEIFQADVKPALLAQAVRVYLSNQRQGTQSAKTRAEINRTRHKLYKQKGTGGARHGDRKAPIFVGGGITFAPKPRDYSLSFPGRLKKKALYGALTAANKSKNLSVVSGLDKLTGKTAELAKFLAGLEGKPRNSLLVTDIVRDNIYKVARNIPRVTVLPASQLNTYTILKSDRILMMEEAVEKLNEPAQIKEAGSEVKEKKIEKRSGAKQATIKSTEKLSKPMKIAKKIAKAKKS